MNKVGHDKRLNYYQQTAEEVIADLRSHRYGLTNPEAQRRLEQNGGNLLPFGAPHSPMYDVATQAKSWPVMLLLVATAISLWQQNDKLAFVLLVVAASLSFVGAWREQHIGALLHNLDQRLPRRATVRRNGIDTVIDAEYVVVGDLLVLDPGAVLAADARLIEADKLLVDESLLHGSDVHAHKFVHPLSGQVPLQARDNQVFAGTTVTNGSGLAVVTATGAQTEVGRLLSLAQATRQKRSRFQSRITDRNSRLSIGIALLAIAIITVATLDDWSLHQSQTTLLTLLVAASPIGALLSMSLVASLGGNRAKRSGVQFRAPSAIDRLGEVDVALIDDSDFIVNNTPTVRELLVGKQAYPVSGDGYSPTGHIAGRTKKPLGAKTIKELRLLFEAALLSTEAKLLPPDADHNSWHGVGPSDDRLLVTLAARAGFVADTVRATHPLVRRFPYDHQRKLGSALFDYDHRRFAFAHGDASAVLAACTSIWESGHTRKITKADQARLDEYIDTQTKFGNHVVALAYRKFTAKQAESLSPQDTEQALTLLGLVAIGRPALPETPQAILTLVNDAVACSLFSHQPPATALAIAAQAGLQKPSLITSAELRELADSQLLELIRQGGAVLSNVTGEDRLRMVDVAQRSGHHVLVTGRSLKAVPAMHHAHVSLVSTNAPAVVREEADAVLLEGTLHALTRSLNRSRHLITNANNIWQGAFTDGLALVLLTLLGVGLYSWHHLPLAVTPLAVVALLVLLQPLLASALDTDNLDARPARSSLDGIGAQVFLAATAALLALASFLLYFISQGLSPDYIDSASTLYFHAVTVSLASLAIFQWINLLFIRANHTKRFTSPKLWQNRNVWWTLGLSLLVLGNVIYNPLLQRLLDTQALTVSDWLIVAVMSLAYGGIRWVVRHERKHSRHAIVELHQQVHGKHAAPRI